MALRLPSQRALTSALRPCSGRSSTILRASLWPIPRPFSASASSRDVVSDTPNMRYAKRGPEGELHVPPVNPADKYASQADQMHRYGNWLMGCLPKYIQQFSVWKDELVIYIPPSGVIPVFSFLKCESAIDPLPGGPSRRLMLGRPHLGRVHGRHGHHGRRLPDARPAIRGRV